jgi:hypothetical protein
MKPVSSGYADVNGIMLYHEIYGEGDPLVLIHGGLTTIGEMQGWVGHTHIRLAAASEDVLTGALRTAWKLRIDKRKDQPKKPVWRSAAE